MKTTFFLMSLFLLLACQKENWDTIRGTWKMVRHHNLETGDSESKPKDLETDVILTFEDFDQIGSISGRTIRNSLIGDYILLPNQQIDVTELITTLAYEPEWGQLAGRGLSNSLSYIRDRNSLIIRFNDEREALEFKKQ